MQFYQHRINTLADLERVPESLGIEFDLRSDGPNVIITHDPFTSGPTIDEFFARVGKRPCIFNIKCDGIETFIVEKAKKHGIEDYFFIDVSVPGATKLAKLGERRFSMRYSEIEPIEHALVWKGKAEWVGVDCWTAVPADRAAWAKLEGFKIALVSPELQGHGTDAIAKMYEPIRGLRVDAICSKRPDLWEPVLSAS